MKTSAKAVILAVLTLTAACGLIPKRSTTLSPAGRKQAEAFKAAYEEALVARTAVVKTTDELIDAHTPAFLCAHARTDLGLHMFNIPRRVNVTYKTSQGDKTEKEMREACHAIVGELLGRTAQGCGQKALLFDSRIGGDGVWARPGMVHADARWRPIACDAVKAQPPRDRNRDLVPLDEAIRKTCGPDTAFIFHGLWWNGDVNALGQVVTRFVNASCLAHTQARDDWYLTPRRRR